MSFVDIEMVHLSFIMNTGIFEACSFQNTFTVFCTCTSIYCRYIYTAFSPFYQSCAQKVVEQV